MTFLSLIYVAIIVEGIITYVKNFSSGQGFKWEMLVAVLIGIVVALAYNIDLFELVGLKGTVPYVGSVLTGILISRGSNYIFDLIKSLQSAKDVKEEKAE